MSVFARFPARLQEAISARLGWTVLRPVQEQAGQAILDGHNAVVLAPTAGGKTEAAMFPVLANLVAEPGASAAVRAIYIAPIKALLNNQADRLGLYTEMVGLERFLWHGDVGPGERKRFLDEPADLLMTTPESLEVMMMSPRVPARRLFRGLRAVTIDEVHAFVGDDRGGHLSALLERLARFCGHDIQRIGLSATVGNPGHVPRRRPATVRFCAQHCQYGKATFDNTPQGPAAVRLDGAGTARRTLIRCGRLGQFAIRLAFRAGGSTPTPRHPVRRPAHLTSR